MGNQNNNTISNPPSTGTIKNHRSNGGTNSSSINGRFSFAPYDRDLHWRSMQAGTKQMPSSSSPISNPYTSTDVQSSGTLSQGNHSNRTNSTSNQMEPSMTMTNGKKRHLGNNGYGIRPFKNSNSNSYMDLGVSYGNESSNRGANNANDGYTIIPSTNTTLLSSNPAIEQDEDNLAEFQNEWFGNSVVSSGMVGTDNQPSVSSVSSTSQQLPGAMTSLVPGNGNGTGSRTPSTIASPSTSAIFGLDPMNDYESGFYSIWNGTNGGNGLGYEPEAEDRASVRMDKENGNQFYLPSEEELKVDYTQMPEFNNGDLDYIYGTMDPSTSSTSSSLSNVPSSGLKEPHMERILSTSDLLLRREKSNEDLRNRLFRGSFSNLQDLGDFSKSSSYSKRPPPIGSPPSFLPSMDSTGGTAGIMNTGSGAVAIPPPGPVITPRGSKAKRPRSRQCDFPGCTNRARSHQKCKKHGGAHQCIFEGCTKNSQSRGLCIAHGGGSRCKIEGCARASQSKGLCKSHGGGEFCAVEGCKKKAHLKHLCRTHGGGVRCKQAKCVKWAQRKGWCMAHAKENLG